MKRIVRDIFPGGNTPYGFFSYYDHILSQKDAEKIICIKGGPGVGKSTLMKSIAEHYINKGERVDLFWCSADPKSLDGVLLKERNVSIIDGTAPHIIDPRNPGAVDEIIDLARYLDKDRLKKEKEDVIECNNQISERYKSAYTYLKRAKVIYDRMADILNRCDNGNEKAFKDTLGWLDKRNMTCGRRKKFFAEAITSDGIKSFIGNLAANIEKVYIIKAPVGYTHSDTLKKISHKFTCAGYDVEEFYSPLEPSKKVEHIISADAGIGVFTVSENKDMDMFEEGNICSIYETTMDSEISSYEKDIYDRMKNEVIEDIYKSIELLDEAKKLHDILESYYIKNMDFSMIDGVRKEIITQIS